MFSRGSNWRKWDLHIHTKGTAKNDQFNSANFDDFCVTLFKEALLKEIAIKAGVTEADIITESKSITVADNIRSSLNLLDEIKFAYKNIIIVNSPYTQRRSYSHLQKYTTVDTRIYRVNCYTREGLRRDDWFTNEEGIIYVLTEYYKLWFGLVINTN